MSRRRTRIACGVTVYELADVVAEFSERELAELEHVIDERRRELALEAKRPRGREVLEERRGLVGGYVYRLELVKCGKASCRCATGKGHGPYWYAYAWSRGRTVSYYVGRDGPGVIAAWEKTRRRSAARAASDAKAAD